MHWENFRDSCARPRTSFTNVPASRAALRAGVEMERILDGYPTLADDLSHKSPSVHGRCALLVVSFVTQQPSFD